jgi:hypothetical protein
MKSNPRSTADVESKSAHAKLADKAIRELSSVLNRGPWNEYLNEFLKDNFNEVAGKIGHEGKKNVRKLSKALNDPHNEEAIVFKKELQEGFLKKYYADKFESYLVKNPECKNDPNAFKEFMYKRISKEAGNDTMDKGLRDTGLVAVSFLCTSVAALFFPIVILGSLGLAAISGIFGSLITGIAAKVTEHNMEKDVKLLREHGDGSSKAETRLQSLITSLDPQKNQETSRAVAPKTLSKAEKEIENGKPSPDKPATADINLRGNSSPLKPLEVGAVTR